jgi:hypothetical protein
MSSTWGMIFALSMDIPAINYLIKLFDYALPLPRHPLRCVVSWELAIGKQKSYQNAIPVGGIFD